MNPDESPPSLSSPAIRSFDQVDPISMAAGGDSYTPAMSFSGHFPGPGNSVISNEGSDRGLNSSYQQPLSRDAVRPLMDSQVSDSGDHYPSDQPPSRKDVRELRPSQTGPSVTGNQITYAEAEAGMSLTADDFRRIDPNAFQKDK